MGENKMAADITNKPFFTYEQQLELLKSRGLNVNDEAYALLKLRDLNYYRLSAYSLTLRTDDVFREGTTFEDIMDLYRFDEHLRHVVLRASLSVECSVRAYLSYSHAKAHGSLGYLDSNNFINAEYHADFAIRLSQRLEKSSEPSINHYKDVYNGVFPFWVAVEAMSFGMLSLFYKNMIAADKKAIAKDYYGAKNLGPHLVNWLHCCVSARNVAAHGSRFYNRTFPTKVLYKDGDLGKFENNTPFALFYALFNMLPSLEEKRAFIVSMNQLFSDYPTVNLSELGFPANWADILAL
jgi:abortive infection bacteriophage resistance protein